MFDSVVDQFGRMTVFVFVPVVTGVEELAPCRRANPVFGCISSGLHEALGGSSNLLGRLLECKLEPGPKLFPVSWSSPFPRCDGGDWRQRLVTCPEVGPSSLSSPRVFL